MLHSTLHTLRWSLVFSKHEYLCLSSFSISVAHAHWAGSLDIPSQGVFVTELAGTAYKSTSRYFWPIVTPFPLSHFVTYPGTPKSTSHISDPPRFLLGLVQKPRQKPSVQIL